MGLPSTILVLGAGELGTSVLEALSHHTKFNPSNTKITVLVRESSIASTKPSKVKELAHFKSLGIDFLAGDITNDSERSLASKFKDFEVIVGCLGMTSPAGTQVKLCKAVLAAGVRKYIPWQFGVDYDIIGRSSSQNLFSEQLDVRDLLRGQKNTNWVIISTGIFMSFLVGEDFGVVSGSEDERTVRALGSWENRVTVTDVGDIGAMVTEVVFKETEVTDEIVFVGGESISYGRLADVVERVWSKNVVREEWSVDFLKEKQNEEPGDGMRKYRVIFAEGRGVAWDMEKTLNVRRGIQLQTVEEWLGKSVFRDV